ncbi:hypothetical protein [Enterocloster lavalensis]|uniref:hypothetical protein n=1 Tax=Enterocloster lavalensis TaxID=460384 RepID=UPI002A837F7A|nr:hypothetical protein [Enterocloster lavalensis]
MSQNFLEQESTRANRSAKKQVFGGLTLLAGLLALLYFLMKDSFDMNDPSSRQVLVYLGILVGVMLVAVVVRLFKARRTARNGENLALPFNEDTKEAVAGRINREASEGKILVDEYIYHFEEGKKPYGERVVLLPSYLLIFDGNLKVTAIPRDKIYWICAQVGRKGGSFIVQLLIFTEKKIFRVVGVDVEHVQRISAQIDRYIPNVFSDYDPFQLSYELEKLFADNREEFLRFYESEKGKRA